MPQLRSFSTAAEKRAEHCPDLRGETGNLRPPHCKSAVPSLWETADFSTGGSGVRVSVGDLCEAEAPTKPTGETSPERILHGAESCMDITHSYSRLGLYDLTVIRRKTLSKFTKRSHIGHETSIFDTTLSYIIRVSGFRPENERDFWKLFHFVRGECLCEPSF